MQLEQKIQDWINKNSVSNSVLWLVFISWTLFVTNLWLPRNWGFYGHHDWDLTYATFEAARKSIVEFSQFPAFNPYSSFGTDFWSNPQSVHLSIYLIPVLIFGTFYGYKISIIIGVIIGLWGAYLLFLKFSKQSYISIVLAMLFVASAYFSRHIFEAGHSNVLFFYLLPFAILFFYQFIKENKRTSLIKFLLIMIQILIGGAPFVFIAIALLIGIWIIGISIIHKKVQYKYFIYFIITMSLIVGISMFKLLPVIQHWSNWPRIVNEDSGISLLTWVQSLADYNTDTRTWHDWFEFSLGINLALFVLFIYFLKQLENRKIWLLLTIPFIWICLGNTPYYFNPWYLLNQYVPVFKSLRAPYRFGILLVFSFYLSLSIMLRNKQDIKWVNLLLIIVLFSQTLHYNSVSKLMVNGPRIEEKTLKLQNKSQPIPIIIKKEDYRNQFRYVHSNYMVLNSYEPMQLEAVNDTLKTLVSGGVLKSFSPNKLLITTNDSLILINYRYSPHWNIIGKGVISNKNGLLAIQHHDATIELSYNNNGLRKGIIYSLISVLFTFIFLFYYKFKNQI